MGVEHTPEAMERIRRSTYKAAATKGLAKARAALTAAMTPKIQTNIDNWETPMNTTDTDLRPFLDLTYVSDRLCIGVTELDENGIPVRSAVLATQEPNVHDSVMLRRYDDMARLMGDNVRQRRDLWLTEDEAADEADARNSDDPDLDDTNQAWQTAYINVGLSGEDGYWTVTLVCLDED